MHPVDVKKANKNRLAIVWDDGHESIYAVDMLRKKCPCASCRSVQETQHSSSLRILSPQEVIPENIEIKEAEVVGRYALQFRWSDGHHEGIYTFEFLRQLCQCEQCNTKEKMNL
ncbi:MAG: gamma-butyrobetaine hydroxylase-like domain-containing protein [bacterium]